MGLLAPAFLIAVAAVALPLWLHRLKTQSSQRQPFSSAMLLESSEERVHVQRKLKYLVLLAMRIALLALLAIAFAKPFIVRPGTAVLDSAAGSLLVVVDTSVSMQRTGVFDQALSAAREIITGAPDDVAIQVVAAADGLTAMSEVTLDKAPQRASLAALTAGFARLDYGELMSATEQLARNLPQPVSLHLVSDFQASGMPVRFSDLVAASVDSFVPHAVGTGDPVNWTVDLIRESAAGVDVQVSSFGTVQRVADLELFVNGAVAGSQSLTATPQQTVHFALPELQDGDNRISAVLSVDDDLETDNRRYHVIENDPPAEVPLITIDPDGLPSTYLSAALESAAGNRYRVTTMLAGRFDNRVLGRYRWLVLDDVGAVDDELEQALLRYLRDGGNVLAFAGDRAAALEALPVSDHRLVSGEVSDAARAFLSPGQVDTGHPVLATSTGWHSVNVSRSLPVMASEGDRVLIRLDNGDPLLLERAIGQGRMLLVLGGLDNRWNDLPVRPVFVSFIVGGRRNTCPALTIFRTLIRWRRRCRWR